MRTLRGAGAHLLLALAGSLCLWAPGGAAAAQHAVAGSVADEAPSYQINVGHTGSTTLSTGFSTPLKQVWQVNLDADLSFPIIADGAVFTVGGDNNVTALDIATGKKRWTKAIDDGDLHLGATYDNGIVFVMNASNFMSAFATSNGKTKWAEQLPLQPFSEAPPMAVNGAVYTSGIGTGGFLYAISEADGTVLWQRDVINGAFSIPAYGDNGIYVAYPCQFYKFDAATGKTDWHFDGDESGGGGETVVYSNKQVYIQDEGACGDAIAASHSGKFTGSFDQGLMKSGGNPTVFANSKGKNMGLSLAAPDFGDPVALVCWDGRTGQKKWSFVGDGQLSTNPIVVNGIIVVGSASGQIFFVNQKGKKVWQTSGGVDGVLSLTAGEGTLIAVGEAKVAAFVPQ